MSVLDAFGRVVRAYPGGCASLAPRLGTTAGVLRNKLHAGSYHRVALDEAVAALDCGMLEQGALLAFLREKPPALEVALTGRGNIEPLRPYADYITEMRMVAHPFETEGLPARKGIEY